MNDGPVSSVIFAITAYAAGCFNTGYYLVLFLRKRDIRAYGSGSTGARNVGRLMGRAGFFATFAGDALKGAAVIWAARALHADPRLLPWLAPLAVAGHIHPAQLAFRGGKGLATALGAMMALDVRFALIGLPLYFLPRLHPQGHILSGVAPMVVLPFLPFPEWNGFQVMSLCLSSALVLFAHRGNLSPGVRVQTPPASSQTSPVSTPCP